MAGYGKQEKQDQYLCSTSITDEGNNSNAQQKNITILNNIDDFAHAEVQRSNYTFPIVCDFAAFFSFITQSGLGAVTIAAALIKRYGSYRQVAFIGILYAIWIKLDPNTYTGKYRSEWFRGLEYWDVLAGYFSCHRIVRTDKLLKHKKYQFGLHPHGVICFSAVPTFCSNRFRYLFPHLVGSNNNVCLALINSRFYFPLGRETSLLLGCISCDKKSILSNLNQGKSVAVVIGGADEALLCGGGAMRLVLKDRMGFVKTAVETGTNLVPCLAFGENQTYKQVFSTHIRAIQRRLQRVLGFSIPLFYNEQFFFSPIFPRKVPLTTVIGSAIEVGEAIHPKEDEQRFMKKVREVHSRYIEAVIRLHAQYAPIYGGPEDQRLEILSVKQARDPTLVQKIRLELQLLKSKL